MKFNKYLNLLFVLVFTCTNAQIIEIKGKVTDSKSKQPISGTNILVKSSKKGVISDFDGNYSIKVAANEVLTFSNIGYASQEVKVSKAQTLNMVLIE